MKQNLKQFSYYFLLPLFLLIYALFNVFNYLKISEFGVLNLDVRGNLNQLVFTRSGELLKGDIVYGKFHASYPNLGIVSMRFYNQDRDSDDTLVFRIREENQDSWYYEAKYKTDQFIPHELFPFGFPIIIDSDGKNYEFQIESIGGATGSGILIDSQSPVFLAKSTFNKNDLIKDKQMLLSFIADKVINIFGDKDLLTNNLIFFLPLICYAVFVLSKGFSFHFLTGIALAVIIYDIFWLKESYDSLFVGLLFLWTLISRRFHFESRIAAVFALGFLVITPIMLVFGQDFFAEKIAVWAYLFLCVTVVQQIYELKKKPRNQLTLEKFKDNLLKLELDQNNRVARFIYYYYKPALFLLTLFLLFKSGQRVYESLTVYQQFFPNNYTHNFLYRTIAPIAVLIPILVFIYRKTKKHFKTKLFLGFILSVLLFITSSAVINLSTKFRDNVTIISVNPNGISEAWTDITISGQNFGNKPFVGKVVINGQEQRIVDWTNTKIIFRTNPQTTKSGMLGVETGNKTVSNQYQFNYLYR